MSHFRWPACLCILLTSCFAATFGTVVPVIGGASDLVIDEARKQVYLVNTTKGQIEVYSIAQRRLLSAIKTDASPLALALSRSNQFLYVAANGSSLLDIIDLDSSNVVKRVTLPAAPEGVAVGADERVLISTIGSGAGNTANVLLVYDPSQQAASALVPVPVTPPPPLSPNLPGTTGKPFQSARSRLLASPDATFIVGVNIASTTLRSVFVFEVGSGTVLRSRYVANPSGVLAVAPDNSKFMSGSTLFDMNTLQVLAQENMANSPFLIAANTQFNTETNQGGSVFSTDGSVLYAAFDNAPQTTPASRPNISELMLNDPYNLLIQTALQLPENLAGKIVLSADGSNLYALSESGFVAVPIGSTSKSPLAVADRSVILLANDQCAVTADQSTAQVTVNNAGAGRLTATAQIVTATPTAVAGLGGFVGLGPGGGIQGGGGIQIFLPPGIGGGGGTVTGTTPAVTSILTNAPSVRAQQTGAGSSLTFGFNAAAARALGTISPSHDFAIQSNEAINVPSRVRVYQNNRNAEARGEIIPIAVGISANEALEDLVYDAPRQRIYIANSGLNRIEVFDIKQHKLLAGIKVGQLPRSMALTPDGATLYVANSGGENISIVDPSLMQEVGRVKFPPTPLSLNQAISTPGVIAAGLQGPLFLMNVANANGTSTASIWQIVGDQAVPRPASQVIGTTNGLPKAVTGPSSMAATPGGEFIVIAAADGSTYLYDASADDFVQSRTLTTFQQSQGLGYFGPITAGPKGQYYVVNGNVLNQALDPLSPNVTGTAAIPTRPVSALAPVGQTTFARFTQPIRTSTTALASDPGTLEIVDGTTGFPMRSVPVLEGPMAQGTTTGRATTISGRTLAIDSTGSTAYAITTSGLSILPLDPVPASAQPRVNPKGAVNLATYQQTFAPNSLLSIFGTNLGGTEQASSTPLPKVLGGTCVTLGNTALPLFISSSGQINAQIPPGLAAGSYSLVVRSIANKAAAVQQSITVSKYAPAVFMDPVTKQVALVHADASFVNKDHPANRDEPLVLYASGLGATTGGTVTAGNGSPASPPAAVTGVSLYFGDPAYSQAGIIVDWAGLAPGFVGLYQLNIRVPGNHIKGDAVPVTLKIGGVSSPSTGPLVPVVSVQ